MARSSQFDPKPTRHPSSMLDGKKAPFAGDALEGSGTAFSKVEPRPSDQVLHCARDKYFAGTSECRNACAGMDGDSADIVTHNFALARVKAGANLDTEHPDSLGYRPGAADCSGRAVECREKAVPHCSDLAAAEATEFATDQRVVAIE